MKWKEFLKPDLWKIVLLIAIGVFTEYPNIAKIIFNIPLSQIIIPDAIAFVQIIFLFPPLFIYSFILDFFRMSLASPTYALWWLSPVLYLFMILWWYFISCLLVWIYGKVKKKK